MDSSLNRECRVARRWSRFGAVALHGAAGLGTIAEIAFCLLLVRKGLPDVRDILLFEVPLVLSQCMTLGTIFLLAEFLRHFCRDDSPFGGAQSTRLVMTSVLLLGHLLLELVVAGTAPAGALESLALDVDLDLKGAVLMVFLVCLAMVVRYGNALKEDSDAFV
ncbi:MULTISPECIES: hypothetical protein [Atopobiaceae]|uniref:hypothetical protein n=1 Tax=Atopobiaceae TaxID=1643824 RepID=UPI000B39C578|nr:MULTISPECIES: hypothetical protein [Atopobiaceae]MCR8908077.1 hypothetical protein [Thermophilibacter sp. ET337]OUO32447.1 hypothetical protein B5F85_06760 [Olsenella sp. An293]